MNIFQMSVLGSLIILVVILIRALIKDRLPKKMLWALWCIAVFRLVVPVTIYHEWSIFSLVEKMGHSPAFEIKEENASEKNASEKNAISSNSNAMISRNLKQSYTSDLKSKEKEDVADDLDRNLKEFDIASFYDQNKNIFLSIWLIGASVCFGIFIHLYLKNMKEFENAKEIGSLEEVENLKELEKWRLIEDLKPKLKRRISFRTSKKICSPLTYGVVNPTVLLPEDMFEYDDESLRYILYHEYTHIRRFDSLSKMILASVLCIHWFNPFVWLMYVLANRDIELICDECVIEYFGNEQRANYAKALISVEERKLCFSPVPILCSNFIKENIEERIVSIMKKKKFNWLMKSASLVIVIAVVVLFMTSRPGMATSDSQKLAINHVPIELIEKNADAADATDDGVLDTVNRMFFELEKVFSKEEIKRLQSLKYQDYQNLSVEEFQQRAWSDIDNQADMELLETFSGTTFLKSHEYGDLIHYLETTFLPLTSEKWREKGIVINGYVSYVRGDKAEVKEFERLMEAYSPVEYSIKLSILNNKKVSVKEYEKIRKDVEEELIDYIFSEYERYEKVLSNTSKQGFSKQDFSKNSDVVKALDFEKMKSKFKELEKKYSDEWIKVEISDSIPDFVSDEENAKLNVTQTGLVLDVQTDEDDESEVIATEGFLAESEEKELNSPKKSDIDALLRLREPNYEKMSVSEFNKKVLEFSNADYDRTERLNAYVFHEDDLRAVYGISDEENHFITISYMLSGMENAALIRSAHTKQKQRDIEVASFDYVKQFNTKERNSWCNLSYRFHYHLKDNTQISVKERDESVAKMFALTSEFWKNHNLETLLKFDKKSVLKKLQEFAKECSTHKISISVNLEDVFFEALNEHIRQ